MPTQRLISERRMFHERAEEKLTELFRQYGASIHRMCFLYLKDYHLAEDAVSETFLKAYRALPSFRRDASPKTWLTRIAINVCKSRIRSPSYREQPLETFPETFRQICPTEQAENRLWVCQEIMKLPQKYREVILLYYYQECTVKEIARMLRLPATTITGRLKRAKALLKSVLKEENHDDTQRTNRSRIKRTVSG